jgi:hypothetical protein
VAVRNAPATLQLERECELQLELVNCSDSRMLLHVSYDAAAAAAALIAYSPSTRIASDAALAAATAAAAVGTAGARRPLLSTASGLGSSTPGRRAAGSSGELLVSPGGGGGSAALAAFVGAPPAAADDDAAGIAFVGLSGKMTGALRVLCVPRGAFSSRGTEEIAPGARYAISLTIVALSVGVHTVGNLVLTDRVSGRTFAFAQLFDVLVTEKK